MTVIGRLPTTALLLPIAVNDLGHTTTGSAIKEMQARRSHLRDGYAPTGMAMPNGRKVR